MRIALIVEYDGTDFNGWQVQPGLRTVQKAVETALSHIANHPIRIICAGRTDRGVHAKHQVVHFDTDTQRPLIAWVRGTNQYLPPDVVIRQAQNVADNFHARFDAVARSYEYWIDNQSTPSALQRNRVTWFPRPLDAIKMHDAAQYLLGTHDFSALRARECQAHSPIRTISAIEVKRIDQQILLTVTANAFLHHMVRNIVGVLLPIGLGEKPIEWIQAVLASKNRIFAGVTAPPEGLYLSEVRYSDESLKETAHLLSQPANARHLRASMANAKNNNVTIQSLFEE